MLSRLDRLTTFVIMIVLLTAVAMSPVLESDSQEVQEPTDTTPPTFWVALNGLPHVKYYVDEMPASPYLYADVQDDSNISGANYTIGRGNWPGYELYADRYVYDGAYDERYETIIGYLDTPPPPYPGTWEYCVYVEDEHGNWDPNGSCAIFEVTNDFSDMDVRPPEPANLDYIWPWQDHNYLGYGISLDPDVWLYELYYSNQYRGSYSLLSLWWTPATMPRYYHYGAGLDNPDDFYYYIVVYDHHMNSAASGVIAKIWGRLAQGPRLLSLPTSNDWGEYHVVSWLWDSFDEVRRYDAQDVNDPWKSLSMRKPYRDFIDIEFGKGYWINMTRNDSFTALGEILPSVSIDLVKGWNLVGYGSPYARTVSEALSGISSYMVEGYSAESPYHLQRLTGSSMMEPFQAYWIYVPSNTTWVMENIR